MDDSVSRWLSAILILFFCSVGKPAWAAGPAVKKSGSAQRAIVKTDGAQIYQIPNFDAEVTDQLSAGEKILVSKQIYGGYFRFYKVRLPSGKMGYISVLDVEAESKLAPPKPFAPRHSIEKTNEKSRKKIDRLKPMHATRYAGLFMANIDFREESIRGLDARENLWFFGAKLSGPRWLSNFAPIDANIYFHYGAPSYYDSLSSTKPTGYILMFDCNIQAPFLAGDDFLGYLAFGPLLSHSHFKVTSAGRERSLSEVNLGGSFNLGFSYRIQKWAGSIEYKYLMEKSTHRGFLFALQRQF